MKGTRPLTNAEIRLVRDSFDGMYAKRNSGFFMLGVSIGGRVSELLALTIGDVYQNGSAVTDFQFDKNIVKGGETARIIPVNSDGREAIENIIAWQKSFIGDIHPEQPLFPGNKKGQHGELTTLKRQAIHKILKAVFEKTGLNGKLATHTLRKTFAQRLYQNCNDIFVVKEMLGHKNVFTTQVYIGVNYISVQKAVEAMSLRAEDNPTNPFDAFDEAQLIEKVMSLGYTVSKTEHATPDNDNVIRLTNTA